MSARTSADIGYAHDAASGKLFRSWECGEAGEHVPAVAVVREPKTARSHICGESCPSSRHESLWVESLPSTRKLRGSYARGEIVTHSRRYFSVGFRVSSKLASSSAQPACIRRSRTFAFHQSARVSTNRNTLAVPLSKASRTAFAVPLFSSTGCQRKSGNTLESLKSSGTFHDHTGRLTAIRSSPCLTT